MKKLVLPAAALILSSALLSFTALTGTVFPDISGETLEGKKVSLPKDTKGKSSIIALAYSKEAEEYLRSWLDPAYEKFIAKSELMSYDVHLYFIPMFTGAKAATADAAKEKIKKDTDAILHPYVIIYKGDLDKYKTALGMDKKDVPYIFVLDKDGKVVYSTSGAYSDAKMDNIEEHLD
ncbi:MAG: hypothetical protein AB1458_13030 [Bacteroidota bacterium]